MTGANFSNDQTERLSASHRLHRMISGRTRSLYGAERFACLRRELVLPPA